jgi:alpha-tubulin suppressor-like RCC1 family protein
MQKNIESSKPIISVSLTQLGDYGDIPTIFTINRENQDGTDNTTGNLPVRYYLLGESKDDITNIDNSFLYGIIIPDGSTTYTLDFSFGIPIVPDWNELDQDQKDILIFIGYDQSTWDSDDATNLQTQDGINWTPGDYWFELPELVRTELQEIGYTKRIWDGDDYEPLIDITVIIASTSDYKRKPGKNICKPIYQSDIFTIGDGLIDSHFFALKDDGSVIDWETSHSGTEDFYIDDGLDYMNNVEKICVLKNNSYPSFVTMCALKKNGSVVLFGSHCQGGNISRVRNNLNSGVVDLQATGSYFAALKDNGSVITWNDNGIIDNSTDVDVREQLNSGVVKLYSNEYSFAALKEDGSVVTWGEMGYSLADTSTSIKVIIPSRVKDSLSSGVIHIVPNLKAFAALKEDGSVVTWGTAQDGGVSTIIDIDGCLDVEDYKDYKTAIHVYSDILNETDLSSGVIQIISLGTSFAAIKDNQDKPEDIRSIVTWGQSTINVKLYNSGTPSRLDNWFDKDNNIIRFVRDDGFTYPMNIFNPIMSESYFLAVETKNNIIGTINLLDKIDVSTYELNVELYDEDTNISNSSPIWVFSGNNYGHILDDCFKSGEIKISGQYIIKYNGEVESLNPQHEYNFNNNEDEEKEKENKFKELRLYTSLIAVADSLVDGDPAITFTTGKVKLRFAPSSIRYMDVNHKFPPFTYNTLYNLVIYYHTILYKEMDKNYPFLILNVMYKETSKQNDDITFIFDEIYRLDGSRYDGDLSEIDIEQLIDEGLEVEIRTTMEPYLDQGPKVVDMFPPAGYHDITSYAALREDGSVVTWGYNDFGGDSLNVSNQLISDVAYIYRNTYAFAALKKDGSVVTWGDINRGGDSSNVSSQLTSKVKYIIPYELGFTAVKTDGTVISWSNSLNEYNYINKLNEFFTNAVKNTNNSMKGLSLSPDFILEDFTDYSNYYPDPNFVLSFKSGDHLNSFWEFQLNFIQNNIVKYKWKLCDVDWESADFLEKKINAYIEPGEYIIYTEGVLSTTTWFEWNIKYNNQTVLEGNNSAIKRVIVLGDTSYEKTNTILDIVPGWHNIGALSSGSSSIVDKSNINSIYKFNTNNGYEIVNGLLEPFVGYWIKISGSEYTDITFNKIDVTEINKITLSPGWNNICGLSSDESSLYFDMLYSPNYMGDQGNIIKFHKNDWIKIPQVGFTYIIASNNWNNVIGYATSIYDEDTSYHKLEVTLRDELYVALSGEIPQNTSLWIIGLVRSGDLPIYQYTHDKGYNNVDTVYQYYGSVEVTTKYDVVRLKPYTGYWIKNLDDHNITFNLKEISPESNIIYNIVKIHKKDEIKYPTNGQCSIQ